MTLQSKYLIPTLNKVHKALCSGAESAKLLLKWLNCCHSIVTRSILSRMNEEIVTCQSFLLLKYVMGKLMQMREKNSQIEVKLYLNSHSK